jgi:putative Ca2+/H+ antiporter (TMEM165/GDT1 family)
VQGSLSWLAIAWVSVLAAELIGDRSLYAISALAARFRAAPVLFGIAPAFAGKALVAVLLGDLIARLPHALVSVLSAASFAVSAIVIWREREKATVPHARPERGSLSVISIAFSSVFFVEWADPGQLMTAALAARSHAPVSIWLGATLALMTKGAVAVGIGKGVRHVVPSGIVRRGAMAICIVLGLLSLVLRE